MRVDEHLMLIFLWFFREICEKLGEENALEAEEWARTQLQEAAGPLLSLYKGSETGRDLGDALARHGELINRVTGRNIAFQLAIGVMISEIQAVSDEMFRQLPPEVRSAIVETIKSLTEEKAEPWLRVNLN